jgi:hypothetical protein
VLADQGRPNSVPSDFEIVARFYPAMSEAKPWETTIVADGTALQITYVEQQRQTKRSHISRSKLSRLFQRVNESDFFILREKFTDAERAMDAPEYVLTVTCNGRSRQVDFQLDTSPEGRRFFQIWAQLLRAVPSPNPHQTPESFLRLSTP